eukprot:9498070-Pyramimonas_sp.AAC.1
MKRNHYCVSFTPDGSRWQCVSSQIWIGVHVDYFGHLGSGERDSYLGKEMAIPPAEWVPNARTVFFPEASHWINHDAPDKVNAELIAFLKE